ncbi:hypothetical protein WA026_004329 [Henosepilachna vigintioctopunctata]
MEPLPSDPRQPPDGHEFPDFDESFQKTTSDTFINKFALNYGESPDKKAADLNGDYSFDNHPSNPLGLTKLNSMSNTDLGAITSNRDKIYSRNEHIRNESIKPLLHSRSQSLCDISFDKRQNDHWQHLYEQRKKTMSKLKGLVIPDSISESDCSSTINLPEIKSNATVPIETFNSLESSEASNETSQPSSMDSSKFSLISPPWTGNANFPKYSPAFKRKDLQLYSTSSKQDSVSELKTYKSLTKKSTAAPGSSSGDDSTVPVKSVDSSPTRSEKSYDYVLNRNNLKQRIRSSRYSMETSFLSDYQKNKGEINTEDESDNDSAVSSSQSSFISRPTASPSPTRSYEYEHEGLKSANRDYRSSEVRHLKPASVEAINRKNILASAKCRSGKDLKVGSPVMNRKLQDSLHETEATPEEKIDTQITKTENQPQKSEDSSEEYKSTDEDIKVRRNSTQSVNISQPQMNTQFRRLSNDTISNLPPKPTANLLKSKFEIMALSERPVRPSFNRAMSNDSASVFRDNLKPVPSVTLRREERISRFGSVKSLSVTDLRKNFEDIAKSAPITTNLPTVKHNAALNSRKSEPPLPKASPAEPESVSSKVPEIKEKQKTSDIRSTTHKIRKVILTPDMPGASLGITLAGGTDENKEITVHRIRYGSVAYHEGSLTKGDQIVSINGNDTSELSHHAAVELLKAPVETFVIEAALREEITKDQSNSKRRSVSLEFSTNPTSESPPKYGNSSKKANHEIVLLKDGNGLGFSVEGGKDSPQGDVPLIVKKIFQGGVAEKDGRLKVGDEVLTINDIDFTNLSRIQAWTMMKKLDNGNVKIMIFR